MNKQDQSFRRVIGAALFVIGAVFIFLVGVYRFTQNADMLEWSVTIFEQFVIGIFSISFALIVVDPVLHLFQSQHEELREKEQLKQSLISKLRSRVEGIPARAIEELEWHGWLKDGEATKGKQFIEANFKGATLMSIDFEGASLQRAIFEKTHLMDANMLSVHAEETNFRGADMTGVNFKNAELAAANFEGTYLDAADFSGADLERANLKNASIYGAKMYWDISPHNEDYIQWSPARFDENTVLPNSMFWTPETDMRQFTDPNHPNFFTDVGVPERDT